MKYVVLTVAPLLLVALFAPNRSTSTSQTKPERTAPTTKAIATWAGGCFWCVEADFEKVAGVTEAISGYAGGDESNPTYEQVSSGRTGHVEAVQVMFDPTQVSYSELLEVFWKHVDPTDNKGQFVDRGGQYRTAIFYHDETQKRLAEKSKKALAASGIFDRPIVTEIRPLKRFYKAEEYHQDYYKNHAIR
ncbi:MAG: peptide-methionine (S)-S-oxide reductase MsrA, partial [Acidobacteriota bacterium]